MTGFLREKIEKGEFALEFTVEGSGGFPLDMLRYDGCYPATEAEDVPAIAANYSDGPPPRRRRVVLRARPLMGEKYVNLTPDRWASFGWKFIGIGDLCDAKRWPTPVEVEGNAGEYFHRASF